MPIRHVIHKNVNYNKHDLTKAGKNYNKKCFWF